MAHKVVLAEKKLTHFLRGWVALVIRKVKVLCYRVQTDLSNLEREIARKLVAKILLKVFNYLAKNHSVGGPNGPPFWSKEVMSFTGEPKL